MNLILPLRRLVASSLVPAIVFCFCIFTQKTYAAFVPAGNQVTPNKPESPVILQNTYSVLAVLNNNDIERLTGRKLTINEKVGLYLQRRQNRKKGSTHFQIPPGWVDKCFTMYLKNGDVIEVKLIQISTTEIKYQRCNKPDDPEIVIAKADVFSIKDENGEAIYSSKDESWKNGSLMADGATDKLALAAGITGIAAVTLGLLIWPIGLAAGIAAGIMGIMSMGRFKKNRNLRGEGWAITGIIAGSLWVLLGVLVLIYFIGYY